tara:strand:+ start:1289 stop:1765 length:477 start_codon:yes stop_codon:yes gene_type:complete
MNYLNGILIDPFQKKVTTVKVDTANILRSKYDLIGCDMVELVNYTYTSVIEDIWCDEEGLAVATGEQRYFKVSDLPNKHHGVIAGKGLILGSDNEGDTISTSLTIGEVLPRISWDFSHNNRFYNSDTGLFTELKVQVKLYDPNKSIVDSIKSIRVIGE